LTTPATWSRVRRLLDGNLQRAFGALLPGHRVDTVHRRRWSDFDDRPLLDAAETEYGALITIDQGLQFQQNLRRRRVRIVLIRAPRNTPRSASTHSCSMQSLTWASGGTG
jgi:hypothetical protein